VLCLCACASRYSDDPRVLLEGTTAWHSSGWKWFSQVQRLRQSLMGPPLLYDVQMYVVRHHFLTTCVGAGNGLIHASFVQLACLFLQGCSAPQSCWTMVGVGLRLVQDVGKHRKRVYNSMDPAEAEQWRRTFWFVARPFFCLGLYVIAYPSQGSCCAGPADERISWSAMRDPRGRVCCFDCPFF
jgi:hypothetical protein